MARFQYVVLSRAVPGREEEFVEWYRTQHLLDVCRMPGVVGGTVHRMDFQRTYDLPDAPQWTLLTIYELEGDDPEAIVNSLRDASGSATMPATDTLDKSGMIQAAGHLLASGGAAGQPPAREFPAPEFLSDIARAYLAPLGPSTGYPSVEDKQGWRDYVATREAGMVAMLTQGRAPMPATVSDRDADGAKVFDIVPAGLAPDRTGIVLDIHGGALILCGGDLCRIMGMNTATRLQRRVWSVDYRMPPDHPYPAALDDCIAAYRALLREYAPEQIIVSGGSAGGNLAAALMLRARDEGLPLPAGLVLGTPEADLTESGDSFQTNDGVDPMLRSLMPVNLLYANGQDLRHPYLSPLFGDFAKGFPPTLLTTGTRDLYLSNTVRMHRALRAAGIPAELHVLEAAPHTGFPGSPEGEEIDQELRRFIAERLGEA
jgi:acetyl esterase/lipase